MMADYQRCFGVGRIALVADRGLISKANVTAVHDAGFEHVLATRLHNDADVKAVLAEAALETAQWVEIADLHSSATEVVLSGRRFVVVDSPARYPRDHVRHDKLTGRVEDKLIALADRLREGRLVDPAKIGAAADGILRDLGVGRCFAIQIREGFFAWDFDQAALSYDENLLAGRYVLQTSLGEHEAGTAQIVRRYRALQRVERRLRVLQDFLGLRPVYHFTESRVLDHITLCVLAAVIGAVMAKDLAAAKVMDPEVVHQVISLRRALAELNRIRQVTLEVHGSSVTVITTPNALQAQLLKALRVDTSSWDRAKIA